MTHQTPIHAVEYRGYLAWDAPTRWFHWINVAAVLGLIATGLVVLNDDALGLSAAGKILLKSLHVLFGYVMGANLLWRFIWAFYGNRYARWRAFMPGGPGYLASLRAYAASFLSGEPQQFVGHNPLARIGVTLLLLLLFVQLATGLVIAGTDLFWPPFGHWFAQWVAAPGVDSALVQPGAVDMIDKASYEAMRALRGPFVEVHEVAFYALAILIAFHLAAVVFTELYEGGGITSAMFTGRKILTRKPPDEP
ncbi:cytochrome b/b6 domain-containing protein [Methylocapsa sp. D3K7]|uniref:cytochrome b/b6 domain-containing protein n=1 Tax=Methylocapsa sp. D3K7 TaxID=3041435 RepID=UPI00244E9A2E|nr:cytochrome b/b6 domain-containing protein [Methylocapsa sp. D3K7]WGJ13549.1 cytochrome b/b6 domain-containing protein [Methylocapsa sp. D3K7]